MSISSTIRSLLLVAAAAVLAACGDPAATQGIHTGDDDTPGGGTDPGQEVAYTPIKPASTGTWNGTAAVPSVTDGTSIPSYSDDYRSIASWANKDKWNLANVHDPSVAYFGGYY